MHDIAPTSYLVAAILTLVNLGWLATILFGLPGTWLMVLSTVIAAWIQWQPGLPGGAQAITPWTLVVLVVLALVGEVLEFIAGAAGAKKAGGSGRGAVAAIVGGVVGAVVGTFMIPIPLIGSLMGAAGGAGLAAWGVELAGGKTMDQSVQIGMGAGFGRLLGTLYKLGVGVAIWVLATLAAFWP